MSPSRLVLAKWALGVLWVLAAASFLGPTGSRLATFGQMLFWFMLVAHALECLLYWRTLTATGRGLIGQVLQTILFGVVHYQSIKREAEQARNR